MKKPSEVLEGELSWDAIRQVWLGCEHLGPEPEPWGGPVGTLAAEPGLHAYQRRNIPLVSCQGEALLGGPRPPYFSWHGHPERTGQPEFSMGDGKVAGHGVYLAQRYNTAAGHAGSAGEVLAFYANAPKLVLLDARWERNYTGKAAAALGISGWAGGLSGWDLLFALNRVHGRGAGITAFLRSLGFNGITHGSTSRGEGGWCIFDPRVFKRFVKTDSWSLEEIRHREAFDPAPISAGSTHFEDGGQ